MEKGVQGRADARGAAAAVGADAAPEVGPAGGAKRDAGTTASKPDVRLGPDSGDRPLARRFRKVQIDSRPGGALVKVRGRALGKRTPVWNTIPNGGRGTVIVEVFLAGFPRARLRVNGKRRKVKVKLKPGGPLRGPGGALR